MGGEQRTLYLALNSSLKVVASCCEKLNCRAARVI